MHFVFTPHQISTRLRLLYKYEMLESYEAVNLCTSFSASRNFKLNIPTIKPVVYFSNTKHELGLHMTHFYPIAIVFTQRNIYVPY